MQYNVIKAALPFSVAKCYLSFNLKINIQKFKYYPTIDGQTYQEQRIQKVNCCKPCIVLDRALNCSKRCDIFDRLFDRVKRGDGDQQKQMNKYQIPFSIFSVVF